MIRPAFGKIVLIYVLEIHSHKSNPK